jgi:hypothetical protein
MKEEVKSILFKNFTDQEFVCSWDSVPYRFPAGKEMYVEDWKAQHFAKHLVDRVMNQKGMITTNMNERTPLLKLAMPDEEAITNDEAIDIEARKEVAEKKTVKKTEKKVEEEFAGLKNK